MFFALASIFFDYLDAISRLSLSMDARPTVSPDIIPEMTMHQKETVMSIHQSKDSGACLTKSPPAFRLRIPSLGGGKRVDLESAFLRNSQLGSMNSSP